MPKFTSEEPDETTPVVTETDAPVSDRNENSEAEKPSKGEKSNWIQRFLKGTHHHYSCFLPEQIGRLSTIFLKLFYSGIRLEDRQAEVIRQLPENAIIVYVSKYRSNFQFLFYHTRYRSLGLPVPEIGFGHKVFLWQPLIRMFRILVSGIHHLITHRRLSDPYGEGYFSDQIENGKSALLSLVDRKGFYKRFIKAKTGPFQYLIELQKSLDKTIYIVPQLMFFSKKAPRSIPTLSDILFGTEENPGKLRRLVALFKNPGQVFVEISEPVDLKAFIQKPEYRNEDNKVLSVILRQQLLTQLDRHRQSITGPILKSRQELKENILTTDRLRSFMESYSESRSIPIYEVHRKADGYIDEIAAEYSPSKVKILSQFVKLLIALMFEGVTMNTEQLVKLKSLSRRGPLVLVPCHKSHIDYLILAYMLFINDVPLPQIAAGKNLSFWPLGPIFRSGGAFFIRRTFKGAVLYSKVFAEYVFTILKEGFHVEFFIEGGRSRTGKLLPPKLGLLSILINAFKEGACDDLIFVPIYIGYDRVPEESAYLHEMEGGQKKPESLFQVIKARKFVKKRYGRIYIKFNEAISLVDYMQLNGHASREITSKQQNQLTRKLGYKLLSAIDEISVVTPHAIMAGAVLNQVSRKFTREQLMKDVETYLNYLIIRGVTLADTLHVDPENALAYVFDIYTYRKFVEQISPGKDEQQVEYYTVNTGKRPLLDYYKNGGIAFFIPAAFTATAILEKDAFQFTGTNLSEKYRFLQTLFGDDFCSDLDQSAETMVRQNIKYFIDDAILMPHPTLPDTYNLTSAGFRKLKLFAAFLITFLESYWIVLNFFSQYPKNYVDNKNRLKKIQSMGYRMLKREEIERSESLSRFNYKNAVDFFMANGIRGSEDAPKINYYMETINRYLNILYR